VDWLPLYRDDLGHLVHDAWFALTFWVIFVAMGGTLVRRPTPVRSRIAYAVVMLGAVVMFEGMPRPRSHTVTHWYLLAAGFLILVLGFNQFDDVARRRCRDSRRGFPVRLDRRDGEP
jgi:hypothetical protein